MSILFTFPGQGAQRVGMLHALPDSAHVRATVDEASEVLGLDARGLDSEPALRSTVATQLCLLVAGVATARHLVAQAGPPDAVAGFSVGAYAAAVTASVLSYADALRSVSRRARLMEAAFPTGFGMVAVLGMEAPVLQALIAQVHAPHSPVYLANLNAPRQLVIAGSEEAMARVAALAQERGAQGIKPVAISVPSHCELLAGPAEALAHAMRDVPVAAPQPRYYSASLARELRDASRIAHDLAHNMALPVQWHDTSMLALERGARLVIEMSPGSVLTKLGTQAAPHVAWMAAADTRVDTLGLLMDRERQQGD